MSIVLPLTEKDAEGTEFYLALSPSAPPLALRIGRYNDPHGSQLVLDEPLLRLLVDVIQQILSGNAAAETENVSR